MNPETESRLAALIMEEASRLRRQADIDGVGAYLAKPVVKSRPNRQFLHAMVRSVQQANRIVEVNEMWRQRSVELDQESHRERHSHRSRKVSSLEGLPERRESLGKRRYPDTRASDDEPDQSHVSDHENEGLKDEDVEQFLLSRVKRGRGAVGSRMDEPGPYCARAHGVMSDAREEEEWEEHIGGSVAGPSLMPGGVSLGAPDFVRESKMPRKKLGPRRLEDADDDEGKSSQKKQRRESKERKRRKEKRAMELEKLSKWRKRRR